MAHRTQEDRYMRPIENLQEYIQDKAIRDSAGWINGMYHVNGKYYTEEEFNQMFPAQLRYRVIQLDGKQIKVN